MHMQAGLSKTSLPRALVLPRHTLLPWRMQEVIELDDKDQRKLWEEVSRVCRALKSSFAPGLKLNIAAIGNVVSTSLNNLRLHGLVYLQAAQLHMHSILCSFRPFMARPLPRRGAAQAIHPRRPRAGRLCEVIPVTQFWRPDSGRLLVHA